MAVLLIQFINCVMDVLQVEYTHLFVGIVRTSFVRWRSFLQTWIGSLSKFGNFDTLLELLSYFQATNYSGISTQMIAFGYALP